MNKELKEILECFEWTFDNMGTPHTSDHFNMPANGIEMLRRLIDEIEKTKPCECGCDTETGRIYCTKKYFKQI